MALRWCLDLFVDPVNGPARIVASRRRVQLFQPYWLMSREFLPFQTRDTDSASWKPVFVATKAQKEVHSHPRGYGVTLLASD
jgi:hypothetical protein